MSSSVEGVETVEPDTVEPETVETKPVKKKTVYSPEYYKRYKDSIKRAQAKYRQKNKQSISKKNLERYHNMPEKKKERTLMLMREYAKKKRYKPVEPETVEPVEPVEHVEPVEPETVEPVKPVDS